MSGSQAERRWWWIGDREHPEFAPAWESLQAEFPPDQVFQQADEALAALAHVESPQLILLATRFPGDLPSDTAARLIVAAPLARSVALLGSLCEGEGRSGVPWPGVVRYYWHQWQWRLAADLRRWRHGGGRGSNGVRPSRLPWELPLTATEDERCLLSVWAFPGARTKNSIAVAGYDAASVETLAECVRAAGYPATIIPYEVASQATNARAVYLGMTAVIWDGCGPFDQQRSHLARLAQSFAPLPVVAVLGFPRHQDILAATADGVRAVVSKPYQLGELALALDFAVTLTGSPQTLPATPGAP